MGGAPHPTWPLLPRPTLPWLEARPVALPDSPPASWPGPALLPWQSFSMSMGLLLLLHLSLGPEPLQGGPGGCQAEGRFPEAPGVLGPGQALTPGEAGGALLAEKQASTG